MEALALVVRKMDYRLGCRVRSFLSCKVCTLGQAWTVEVLVLVCQQRSLQMKGSVTYLKREGA